MAKKCPDLAQMSIDLACFAVNYREISNQQDFTASQNDTSTANVMLAL